VHGGELLRPPSVFSRLQGPSDQADLPLGGLTKPPLEGGEVCSSPILNGLKELELSLLMRQATFCWKVHAAQKAPESRLGAARSKNWLVFEK